MSAIISEKSANDAVNSKSSNIKDIKDSTVSGRGLAWMMWGLVSIFYAYQYILRVMPNIIMTDIMQQFNINAATFGQFSGVYYVGYSLMHVPIGLLLDRWGPKKVLPLCILMAGLGMLPIIISDFWIYPIIGRAFIGMGSSAAILGAFKIIRLCFKEERFTRMLGFSVTIGLLGAIYGGGPLNYLCVALGYKMVTALLIGIAILMSVAMYFVVPIIESTQKSTVLSDLKEVFCSRKVLFICFLSGLMVGPLEGFADVWGSQFLRNVYGLEDATAASLPSMIFVGMCFGSPILGYIAEKTRSILATIIGSGILMAIGFFLLLQGNLSVTMISVIFTLIGICCAYQIIAIFFASTYVKENVVGLTTAVANMIIMLFGYFFHSIIGWVINLLGGSSNAQAFKFGIAVIPMCLMIAIIGFIIMFVYGKENTKTVSNSC